MNGLSERQTEVLRYIHARVQSDGVLPSYREIGDAMGIRSTNGVSDHLRALERKGYLARKGASGKGALARAMTLTARGTAAVAGVPLRGQELVELGDGQGETVRVRVFGRVAAGDLAYAAEDEEDSLFVDSCMIPGGAEVFALRVRGESMIEAGIHPGDYLFLKKTTDVRNGQIAVVMVDDEATVKTFYREGDRIRLQPENAALAPILIPAGRFRSVQIVGVVVGVYRRLF